MEQKVISIIGANSYIARNLLKILYKRNFIVKLYDQADNQHDFAMNYTKVDLTSKESIMQIDFNCDILFIFTGKTGTSQGFNDYSTFIDVNEKILLNILSVYCELKSRSKIIFPSTRLLYKGNNKQKLNENSENEFNTIYAMNKFACENYLKMYHNIFDVQYCIFRICVVYSTSVGNTNSYGTIEFFINQAKSGKDINVYGDGSQKRTFVHINDLNNVLIEGALDDRCVNDVFNIGGGDELSISEIACEIANVYNVKVNYVDWPELSSKIESGDTIFDSSKLDKILNYNYEYKFENWINELAK